MGNSKSSPSSPTPHLSPGTSATTSQVFSKEFAALNLIVTNIITDTNVFKDNNYNFLSENVCNEFIIISQTQLKKQLKVNIRKLGEVLFLVPRESDAEHGGASRQEICDDIVNHYTKILYVICLIKYVYNLEGGGDSSIAGVIQNQIVFTNGFMVLTYCEEAHKDLGLEHSQQSEIDLSGLAGMNFFNEYFLDAAESTAFMRSLRSVLQQEERTSLKGKATITKAMCRMLRNDGPPQGKNERKAMVANLSAVNALFSGRYIGSKLVCDASPTSTQGVYGHSGQSGMSGKSGKSDKYGSKSWGSDLTSKSSTRIARLNPVFSRDMCMGIKRVFVPINEPSGQVALKQYNTLMKNYNTNIRNVHSLLGTLVSKQTTGGVVGYTLHDITHENIEAVVADLKVKVRVFYLQSIMDYQTMLDHALSIPGAMIVT